MTFRDGLELFGGIITALGILAFSAVVGTLMILGTGSSWGLVAQFVVLVLAGGYFWKKQRQGGSNFGTGGLIGICIALLISSACAVSLAR